MPLLLGIYLGPLSRGCYPTGLPGSPDPGLRARVAPRGDYPFAHKFSGGVHLCLGCTVDDPRPHQVKPSALTFFGHTTPERNLRTTVALVDDQGYFWSAKQSEAPRELRPVPVTAWQPGQYAQDSHTITILPGTPPGVYYLTIGAF